jgi:ABC-type phosphate/phosphonate transport system substrate-binding protein
MIAPLFVICNGPLVPCLPIIANRTISEAQLGELRQALADSTRDPKIADATSALFISGFDALELEDYSSLRDLTPNN